MSEKKSFLRHEILNLLSIISILLSECGIKKDQKSRLENEFLKLSLLIAYEDVVLGKIRRLHSENIHLGELLGIVGITQNNKTGLWLSDFAKKEPLFSVWVERNSMMDGLRLLFLAMDQLPGKCGLKGNPKKATLVVLNRSLKELRHCPPGVIENLKKGHHRPDWLFALALKLLKLNKVQTRFVPNGLELLLPHSRL